MAPTKSRTHQLKDPSSSEAEVPNSQEVQDLGLNMLTTARDLMLKNKRHRDEKRQNIEEEHSKRVKDVSTKITTLFDARKMKVMKTQKAQWARLEDLNKRRVALEKQILTAMESVEFHTGNIIKEINVILEGRILELQLEDGLEGTTLKDD